MALITKRQKTSIRTFDFICLCLVVTVTFSRDAQCQPTQEITVYDVTFLGYVTRSSDVNELSALIQVEGTFINERHGWRASRNSDDCGGTLDNDFFVVKELNVDKIDDTTSERQQFEQDNDVGGGEEEDEVETRTLEVVLPHEHPAWVGGQTSLYLCSETKTFHFGGEVIKWTPMGLSSSFKLSPPSNDYILNEAAGGLLKLPTSAGQKTLTETKPDILRRHLRALNEEGENSLDYDSKEANISTLETEIISHSRILALQLPEITKDLSYGDDGMINVRQGHEVRLDLYGIGLTNDSEVKLTSSVASAGHACKSQGLHVQTKSYPLDVFDDGTYATLVIPAGTLPAMKGKEILYICLKAGKTSPFLHQGTHKSLQIEVYELLLPVWLMIIFILVLLSMSGLFSGLNLGLMALDQTELKIVQNTGSDRERAYANKISPIRAHGNFLLCSLLLGNVLVNNTLTILLDTLTSGIVAVIGATMAIVIFGEIIPQALCSRHGLAVGAHTIWLTKFFMLVTFPLAYPISKILDRILGAEIGTVYDKKRLIELLRVTRDVNDLEKEEVDIVTGALAYKEKTVRSVMTPLNDAYLLSIKTVLDFETISEIRDQGYSRIPVYDGERSNIVYVLFVKDLMFIDPDDNMPLAMVCEFYKNEVNFVFHDTPLNIMFNEFKSGEKGHMAFVQDVNTSGDGDPFYETIGLITLEDIIEEIIQQEIIDETDVYIDNRTKKRRMKNGKLPIDMPMFLEHPRKVNVSQQLTLAVFQYLTTTIEPFKSKHMSDIVLKKLLTMDVFREIKMKKSTTDEDLIIIEKGKPIDYFVLIVEGRVTANVGKEELIFESGPFSFYGLQVLMNILENPPSPGVTHKVTTPSSAHSGLGNVGENQTTTGFGLKSGGSLRKTSTQISFDLPHILNRRASSITGAALQQHQQQQCDAPGTLSRQGSAIFAFNFTPVIPEYTVKATSDVLYLRIKRATYLRALKASVMSKKPSPGDLELERYLERVSEDDNDVDTMLMSSPKMSPEKGPGFLERASSFISGRITPTLSLRGGVDRLSGHGKQRNNPLNNSFHTFDSDKEKNDDATVEEEDEGEEEFWGGRHSKNSSTPTSPSPVKSSKTNWPLAHVVNVKQATPDREKPPPTYSEMSLTADSTIKEEEEPEQEGSNGAPVSAGAVVINVLSSSPTNNDDNATSETTVTATPTATATDRTSLKTNGSADPVS